MIKYFQNSMSSYEQQYSEDELRYFHNKLEQKEYMILKNLGKKEGKGVKFLDICCGEGFALQYFHDNGYEVMGLDFSKYGIMKHNPKMLEFLIQGDCYESIDRLIEEGKTFDVINMDAALDMVLDPILLIEKCKQILNKDGIFLAKVANNYSLLQKHLLEKGMVTKEHWLDESGHPSYFNKDGLKNLFTRHGYVCVDFYGESFIDFNLVNDKTNYYETQGVGKSCYLAKVELENLFHDISVEQTLEVYHTLGEMGFGREIIGLFRMA